MAGDKLPSENLREPRGFGEHVRGLAGEYAHEQGWGINEDERRRQPTGHQNTDGGNDYEYGARDFGDEPVDTQSLEGQTSGSADDIDKVREVLTKETR